MQKSTFSLGPWQNPELEDGIYEATVDGVEVRSYSTPKKPMIKIKLRLRPNNFPFVTHIYISDEYSIQSELRLSYFCSAVGVPIGKITTDPEAFEDRPLCIEVAQFHSPSSGQQYSDVKNFYPPSPDMWTESMEIDVPSDENFDSAMW